MLSECNVQSNIFISIEQIQCFKKIFDKENYDDINLFLSTNESQSEEYTIYTIYIFNIYS